MKRKKNKEQLDAEAIDDQVDDAAVDDPAQDKASSDADYDPVEHIAELEQERDEAIAKYQRSLADFQNYQRRSIQNERQANEQGIASVARGLLPVMDHFTLALGQDPQQTTVEQFMAGMRIVRDELVKALQIHGLTSIQVEVGDAFDPKYHDAVARVAAQDVDPGCVSNITQDGFMLGDRVLRAVKVTIAPEDVEDEPTDATDDDAERSE
ncbi:MAG: nucleotide exchange factor GrpE [Phycisphaerales bacterium]|nr:nucleotide exchange factor GrpE [Phycisphaerales bacterium]